MFERGSAARSFGTDKTTQPIELNLFRDVIKDEYPERAPQRLHARILRHPPGNFSTGCWMACAQSHLKAEIGSILAARRAGK